MAYNHGLAKKEFENEWHKKERQYRELGMTEEQINTIREFDEKVFRADRTYYEKTIITSEPDNFELPHMDEPSDEYLEENWTEFIDDTEKYRRVKEVPEIMRKAFYMNKVLGMTQRDVSSKLLIPVRTIRWWFGKIAEILK